MFLFILAKDDACKHNVQCLQEGGNYKGGKNPDLHGAV